jgi:hypothetical protein
MFEFVTLFNSIELAKSKSNKSLILLFLSHVNKLESVIHENSLVLEDIV